MKLATFNIYNASAGSGKTFSLVKQYLKILLTSSRKDAFKNILAITFTNKAVGEMKDRIINSLIEFAAEDILDNPTDLFMKLLKTRWTCLLLEWQQGRRQTVIVETSHAARELLL